MLSSNPMTDMSTLTRDVLSEMSATEVRGDALKEEGREQIEANRVPFMGRTRTMR